MAFKIAVSEIYTHSVNVQLPGEKLPRRLDIDFRRLSQDELAELTRRSREAELNDRQFVALVVAGWGSKAVVDDEGSPIEFSAHALDELLKIYPVAASIVTGFYESIGGARQKN